MLQRGHDRGLHPYVLPVPTCSIRNWGMKPRGVVLVLACIFDAAALRLTKQAKHRQLDIYLF
jgi:hypothetical protein